MPDRWTNGVELVGEATKVLTQFVNRFGHVSEKITKISDSAAEQSSGLAEINSSVRQLDQVTQQNAVMSQEANAICDALNEGAQNLSKTVSVFRIKPDVSAAEAAADAVPARAIRSA